MHLSTTSSRSGMRRGIVLALLAALLLLGAAQLAPAALAAAPDFTGGPLAPDYPINIANDHTVSALRFNATAGLAAGDYYVKIRISPTSSPGGTNNRGFTWNPATQKWVNERDAWIDFPVVSTADGIITPGANSWYFFKFADSTKSGAYYLMVSLQPVSGGAGTTQNSATRPAVTILNMATSGAWVHKGATLTQATKRVEADATSLADVWALMRTEPTGVDRFGSGASGSNGDFQLAVPTGVGFDVKVQSGAYPSGVTNTVLSTPDVDIALGASDQTPPSAPGTLTVGLADQQASLSWGASTDDTAVTSYTVYRWVDPAAGTGYTSQPIAVHSGSATSWTDTSLTVGVTYHYLVRAVDAATNVGPRSNTADAVPPAPVTLPVATAGNASVALSWTTPIGASGVRVLSKAGSAPTSPTDAGANVVLNGVANLADDTGLHNGTQYFYAIYAYDADNNFSAAASATATPQMDPAANLVAQAGDGHVELAWDNPAAADFAAVRVLRKEGSAPSAPDDPAATEVYDGSATAADDGGLTNGTEYFYAVFARDVDGVYSPTAETGSATPNGESTLTLSADSLVVAWNGSTTLRGTLRDATSHAALNNQAIVVQSSKGGSPWADVKTIDSSPSGSFTTATPALKAATQFRFSWAGDSGHTPSTSIPVTVTPRASLGKPVVPSSVKKGKSFSVYGSLLPKQAAGSKAVRVKCYVKKNGAWALKKTVPATSANHGSATRYRASLSLPTKGSWKLVAACGATKANAATTSASAYTKVK